MTVSNYVCWDGSFGPTRILSRISCLFFLLFDPKVEWMFYCFLFTHVLHFCTLALESNSVSYETCSFVEWL